MTTPQDEAVADVAERLADIQLEDRPWWYEEALEIRDEEDPDGVMEWDLEFETPIVPNEALADVLRHPDDPLPWWATRDGGFALRDRGMRVGYKDWTAEQKSHFKDIQYHFYLMGYYSPEKKLWCFEDINTFCEETLRAYRAIDHPKARRWARSIETFLARPKQ